MRKLLCTSDGLVWWRIWSGNFNHQIDSGPRCNPSFESGRWSKGCSWLYDNVLWYQEETVLPREGFLLRQVQEVAASHLPIQTGTLHGKLHGKYAYFSWRVPSEQEDEEQQPPTEQNENRKEQDLLEATPEIYQYPEIPSKRNKVEQNDAALGQPTAEENGAGKNENESKRKTEANWRVIVHLPPMRLSNNETQWYRGKRWGRPTRQLLTNKRRKLLLSFLQHPSKTKDLIQGNPCSHGMRKRGTGTSRVVPKRRRACEDSNPVTKRASWHRYVICTEIFSIIFNFQWHSELYSELWILRFWFDSHWRYVPLSYMTFQDGCYLQHDISQYWRDKKK